MAITTPKTLRLFRAALAECDDVASVALTLVQTGGRIAGSELSVWNVKTHDLQHVAAVVWPDPGWNIAPLVPVLDGFMNRHPITRHLRACGWRDGPVRLSDHIPERNYRSSGLYREVYRHLETRYQVVVPMGVDAETNTNLSFNRLTSDFSDRTMAELRTMQTMACRRLRKIRKFRWSGLVMNQLSALFRTEPQGLLKLSPDLRITDADAPARTLLKVYFASPPSRTALPEVLRHWVKSSLRSPALGDAVVLERFQLHQTVIEHAERRLLVTLFCDSSLNRPLLLLKEMEVDCDAPDGADELLSWREKEVLAWVVEGKSNRECAQILGLSPRTVEKHCEHIYAKLGVENRAGAIRSTFSSGRAAIRLGGAPSKS